MNAQSDLYPDPQPLTADRRAALRSTLVSAVAASAARPRFRRRIAAVAASLAAAVFLAVVGLVQPWTTPTPAWAAVPERADAATTARIGSRCVSAIAARHYPMVVEEATPVLAETRGKSNAVLLASANQVQICVSDPSGAIDSIGVYQVGGFDTAGPGLVDGVAGSPMGGNALRVIFGRVASADDSVNVRTTDGLNITASVAPSGKFGYFLAWWPSHADPNDVTVTLPSGMADNLPIPDQSAPSPVHK